MPATAISIEKAKWGMPTWKNHGSEVPYLYIGRNGQMGGPNARKRNACRPPSGLGRRTERRTHAPILGDAGEERVQAAAQERRDRGVGEHRRAVEGATGERERDARAGDEDD